LFQNTHDNQHNIVCCLWVRFRYISLYHNANAPGVGSFSTCSNGTTGQPQSTREGNCQGKYSDISYKSTPVVGMGA
jgi:hypothetical protein